MVESVILVPVWGWKTGVVGEFPLGVLHLIKPSIECSVPLLSVINTVPIMSFPCATKIVEDEFCVNWTLDHPKPETPLK